MFSWGWSKKQWSWVLFPVSRIGFYKIFHEKKNLKHSKTEFGNDIRNTTDNISHELKRKLLLRKGSMYHIFFQSKRHALCWFAVKLQMLLDLAGCLYEPSSTFMEVFLYYKLIETFPWYQFDHCIKLLFDLFYPRLKV